MYVFHLLFQGCIDLYTPCAAEIGQVFEKCASGRRVETSETMQSCMFDLPAYACLEASCLRIELRLQLL